MQVSLNERNLPSQKFGKTEKGKYMILQKKFKKNLLTCNHIQLISNFIINMILKLTWIISQRWCFNEAICTGSNGFIFKQNKGPKRVVAKDIRALTSLFPHSVFRSVPSSHYLCLCLMIKVVIGYTLWIFFFIIEKFMVGFSFR